MHLTYVPFKAALLYLALLTATSADSTSTQTFTSDAQAVPSDAQVVLSDAQAIANDQPVESEAKQIIDQMEALYRGASSRAEITMIVQTPNYQREMQMTSAAMGTEQSFIRIVTPKKDRGISTLKLNNEMWNYFPKINKVIKVPPSMMMGSWMGSDFTNDDLVKETTLTDEYDLQLETTDDQYRITLIPNEQTVTVWGKIEYVVDRKNMIPIEQRFYDDRGTLIRKLVFSNLKQFGKAQLPSRLEMIPLNKTGHKTIIVYDELIFNPEDLDPSVFTLRHLKSRF